MPCQLPKCSWAVVLSWCQTVDAKEMLMLSLFLLLLWYIQMVQMKQGKARVTHV